MKTIFSMFIINLVVISTVFAQEFRAFNQIFTPGRTPEGAIPVKLIESVDSSTIRNVSEQIAKAWNSGDISNYLSEEFYDKTRFLDKMIIDVPKDASIRVLSLHGGQTINQFEKINSLGKKELISTISINIQTQIEFNDIQKGFRRLEGLNEYILRITEVTE